MATATTNGKEVQVREKHSLIADMAHQYNVEPKMFLDAVKSTCIQGNVTDAQFAAFLMVANQYGLNPLVKEIYAFPSKGGIQPIVGIDGWYTLANRHPQYDGLERDYERDGQGNIIAVTTRVHRKDRTHPIEATEFLDECKRNTEPWNKWPARMLRHKADIQAFRAAFGFVGIVDEDEYERMVDVEAEVIDEAPPEPPKGKHKVGAKAKAAPEPEPEAEAEHEASSDPELFDDNAEVENA